MKGYVKYLLFVILLLIILLWLMGFFKSKIKSGEVNPVSKKVSGLRFKKVVMKEETQAAYSGEVEAEESTQISTFLSGHITSVKVKEGDCVPKGALLLTVEGESVYAQKEALNYQVQAAESELKSAYAQFEAIQRTYDRYTKLLKEGAVTPQEFDEVKAKYESAKSSVERAKSQIKALEEQKRSIGAQIKYLNLRAPFSGCVKEKRVNVGDLVLPGQPLLVFEKAPYKIKVELPEKFFSKLKIGNEVKAKVDGIAEVLTTRVVEKSSGLDPKTQTFKVKLSLPSRPELKSGSIAKVLLPEERKTLLIPKKALIQRYDFTGVYVVKPDKTLELRFIKVGEEREEMIEVLSGIREGELVVVEGVEKACNACLVE